MYLLTPYPTVGNIRQTRAANRPTRTASAVFDFITPDGHLVPRDLGLAALTNRTAVLVGGLLVGFWPKAE